MDILSKYNNKLIITIALAYKSFLTFKNISDLIGPLIVLQFIVLLISTQI